MNDTITAIATPPGEGGLSIIRISGKDALRIAMILFHPAKSNSDLTPQKVVFGEIRDPETNQCRDEVLLTFFKAPKSYTAEDVIEISAHGGTLITKKILALVLAQGARLAEPGEFTRRAFTNGRLDLTQAEAVADVIESASDKALNSAMAQLKGGLSSRLSALHETLLNAQSQLEASIDFSEDGLTFQSRSDTQKQIQQVESELKELVDSFRQGKIVREGMQVTLVGKPNVGKSSLLNALLQEDRAIVTPIAGTTRDTLEERVRIKDIHIVIIDSAGLRNNPEMIEEQGIQRTRSALERSDLAIVVFDASEPLDDNDKLLMQELGQKPKLVVLNKSDLPSSWQSQELETFLAGEQPITLSAKTLNGFGTLKEAIYQKATSGERIGESLIITRERHRDHLQQAAHSLHNAVNSLSGGLSEELVAVDVTLAMDHLGIILGKTFEEDLLDKIFGQFCIGK
ncbi:MAG: tRNA uridine-5-carboxymethylaminomethyl(34) synthesis GTPase MnmE [Nitrospina sp.]|nr:tRNA uridine-5-carboxymethylaminomethyl(34) synthesis GTPase MnmE [Nitrospina sp.]MBT5764656.1 tRNA uridine-5-carboxymethylaminomethyl(34) synthesis GTPase MnmE [Nitrospina sp.]